jgi:hypothetical protein
MPTTNRPITGSLLRALTLCVAVGILSYQLFIPPIIGLANNGDFITILRSLHLEAPDESDPERFFSYIVPIWVPHPAPLYDNGLASSETILLAPAYLFNRFVFSRDGSFDLRWTGFTHSVLFLLSLWLLMPVLELMNLPKRIGLIALLLFFFLDVEYVSWFNTFYTDTASLLLLFLLVVLFLRIVFNRGSQRWNQLGFLICCVFFVSSKVTHALAGIPLLVFILWKRDVFGLNRENKLSWCLFVASVLACGYMFVKTPRRYSYTGLYSVIFAKLAPESPHPGAMLQELGLGPEWLRYVGGHAYTPMSGFFDAPVQAKFMSQTSFVKLGVYYLRHPLVALHFWEDNFRLDGVRRPGYFGNFVKNSRYPPGATTRACALASEWKTWLMIGRPYAALLYWLVPSGLLCACAWRLRRRFPGLFEACCVLILMASIEMVTSCFGDPQDADRHLFIYNAMVDVIVIGAFAALLSKNGEVIVQSRR